MSLFELPPDQISVQQVLHNITEAERHHRIVWTAGRVLKEDGSLHQIATGDPLKRTAILRRIRHHLKALVQKGQLQAHGIQFKYGAGSEVSYSFTAPRPVREPLMKIRPALLKRRWVARAFLVILTVLFLIGVAGSF